VNSTDRGETAGAGRTGVAADDAGWDLPGASITRLAVEPADIDAYRHVNNAVYVTWLDRAAWDHSARLGLPVERCVDLDRGMAVLRSTLLYLKPALEGDAIAVGTWLLPTDTRMRALRRFQVRRESDGATLVRAQIEYVCIELSTGRPTRSPKEFRELYVPLPELTDAISALPAI
jgi:acyl-CoA thioester hydrolase